MTKQEDANTADIATMKKDIEHIKKTVDVMLVQVQTTNGRVSSLEKWKYGLLCSIGTLAAAKWPALGALLSSMTP
jgi:hypothetical protein